MKKGQDGYTLLELLVVLAILALVMAVGLPAAVRALDRAGIESDARLTAARLKALRTVAMDLQQDLRLTVAREAPGRLVSSDGRSLELGPGSTARIEGGGSDNALVLGWDGSVSGRLVISRGTRQLQLHQREAYGAIVIEAVR
jgi:prepilin-type N-terminal cleavage/methylation domain-containing protein